MSDPQDQVLRYQIVGSSVSSACSGTTIYHLDTDAEIFRRSLGILHKDVEVAVLVERTAVGQFKLWILTPSTAILLDQLSIGKFSLRILVQILHVGMGRGRIEVEVTLLRIFAVITFIAGKPKDSFLQYRVAPVPQSHGEADQLMTIADTTKTVLIPAIGTRPRMIMGKRFPCRAVRTVVLSHSSPSPFAQIGPPTFPMTLTFGILVKTLLFCQDRG